MLSFIVGTQFRQRCWIKWLIFGSHESFSQVLCNLVGIDMICFSSPSANLTVFLWKISLSKNIGVLLQRLLSSFLKSRTENFVVIV